jgi:hypothetical protein
MIRLATRTFVAVLVAAVMIAVLPTSARSGGLSGGSLLSAQTQYPQTQYSVDTVARNLSNKAQDAFNIASNQRAQIPVDLYVALCGFAGSTRAYSQMAAEGREEAGLRSTAYRLVAQAMDIDTLFGTTGASNVRQAWRAVQENVALLSNTYPLVYTYSGSFRDAMTRTGRTTAVATATPGGRFRWRGRVDGSDYIMLQGNQVSISHLEDRYIQDATYELPAPLPQQPVQAKLAKLKGRGTVEIVRQPTADNRYTLTVLIQDPAGGDDLYEFEVTW